MNKTFLIGNLTRDPELRKTASGDSVCNFTLAVNKRARADHPEADYFRVTCWRQQAENAYKYLSKGKKACVVGAVSLSQYTDRDGALRYNLQVDAQEVEFLSPKSADAAAPNTDENGYIQVPDEELPEGF